MEPMLISDGSKHKSALADLALTLAEKAAAFRSSLAEGVMSAGAAIELDPGAKRRHDKLCKDLQLPH